jgi:hypothetical protein
MASGAGAAYGDENWLALEQVYEVESSASEQEDAVEQEHAFERGSADLRTDDLEEESSVSHVGAASWLGRDLADEAVQVDDADLSDDALQSDYQASVLGMMSSAASTELRSRAGQATHPTRVHTYAVLCANAMRGTILFTAAR